MLGYTTISIIHPAHIQHTTGVPFFQLVPRLFFVRYKLGLTERRGTDGTTRPPLLYGITHALKAWKEGSSREGAAGRGGDTGGRTGGGPRRGEVLVTALELEWEKIKSEKKYGYRIGHTKLPGLAR